MPEQTTLSRVISIVCDQLGVESNEVVPEAKIEDDLGADSLDQVELIMALETEFNIDLADDMVKGIKTIGEVVTLIDKQVAARAEGTTTGA